jgi:hypothetical protein
MPIRNNIEAVVKQLVTPTGFVYGTKKEMNLFLDNQGTFPVALLYPLKPIKKSNQITNSIGDRFAIYMEFLFKTEFDEFTSDNETYIKQSNDLINEFLVKLQHYRQTPLEARFFQIKVSETETSLPVYNKFDANLTGCNLALELKTMTNDNVDPTSRPAGWVAGPYG